MIFTDQILQRTTIIWIFDIYIYIYGSIYYGVSGLGKGLVDAMSAFSVKSLLSRAVITKNLHYNSAEDIHQYMSDLFKDDKTKFYTILTSEDIESFKNDNSPLIIKGCRKLSWWNYPVKDQHMLW